MCLMGTQLLTQAMTFGIVWLPAMELKWGWCSGSPSCLLAVAAAQNHLRLFHLPGQFSGSWRQPLPSLFGKHTNRKSPDTKQPSRGGMDIPAPWKCKYCAAQYWCGCLGLPACSRPLWAQSLFQGPTVSQDFFDWVRSTLKCFTLSTKSTT